MKIKRFKEMFEDAPVNSTGAAVSTDKPIVRKKKKKEDSGYREVGTPELLKRYMDDTPGQSMNESRKKDMTAISSWKKKLKNVKGLSKDVVQQLSQLPTPVVTSLINQIGMIVAQKEELGKNADAGDYIDDFRKSDAPQFKGKSDAKIRKMAIAAYLDAKDKK